MSTRALVAAGAATGAGAWCAPALAARIPPVAGALGIARRLVLPGAVALTFDDGPHPEGTPAVLEILRACDARATFFLVGEQVRRSPGLAREIVAAGHTVAVHADRHRVLLRLAPSAVREDLDRARETLGDDCVPVHRPPYGIYTIPALREIRRRGWYPLLWSRWGRDWRSRATAQSIACEVTRSLSAGDVLLLHDADDYSAPDSWRATVAALPRVLDGIARQGLRPARIDAAVLQAAASGR